MDGVVVNWADVEPFRREAGELGATWRRIGHGPAGVCRIAIDPGARSTPAHSHGGEEEIFYVLAGSGLVWQDGTTCEVGPGDAFCARAGGPAHTLIAGDDGLEVMAFGENADPPLVRLPHAAMIRRGAFWMDAAGTDPDEAEAAAGPLGVPPPGPRPANVIAYADAPVEELLDQPGYGATEHDLGGGTGSVRSGLRRQVVLPGRMNCPPHWHAIEHEIFSVLEGTGTLQLWANDGTLASEHPVGPGDVVRRPLGRARLAHAFVAGDEPLTMLVYGTRRDEEIVYYPRSRKIHLGGVTVRAEPVEDYWDGEIQAS